MHAGVGVAGVAGVGVAGVCRDRYGELMWTCLVCCLSSFYIIKKANIVYWPPLFQTT